MEKFSITALSEQQRFLKLPSCLPGVLWLTGSDRPSTLIHPEKVRHMLYGSLAAIDRTIKILRALGYADPNDGRDPLPINRPNQWMVIMTKILLI